MPQSCQDLLRRCRQAAPNGNGDFCGSSDSTEDSLQERPGDASWDHTRGRTKVLKKHKEAAFKYGYADPPEPHSSSQRRRNSVTTTHCQVVLSPRRLRDQKAENQQILIYLACLELGQEYSTPWPHIRITTHSRQRNSPRTPYYDLPRVVFLRLSGSSWVRW